MPLITHIILSLIHTIRWSRRLLRLIFISDSFIISHTYTLRYIDIIWLPLPLLLILLLFSLLITSHWFSFFHFHISHCFRHVGLFSCHHYVIIHITLILYTCFQYWLIGLIAAAISLLIHTLLAIIAFSLHCRCHCHWLPYISFHVDVDYAIAVITCFFLPHWCHWCHCHYSFFDHYAIITQMPCRLLLAFSHYF